MSRSRKPAGLRAHPAAGALALYLLLSIGLFGIPVLADPAGTIIAKDTIDSSLFMWFFAWWPHALLHGLNPFVTHLMFAPEGFNLQWTTSMPGPSVLLSPVTLAFGPAVTWNVLQLLAPALSGWTGFLLCRYLTDSTGPSLVGGFLFGFSPYELAHLTGGPFLALVPLLPVAVVIVLRRLDDDLSPRRFVVLMALTLIAQFSISTEVLLSGVLFGGIALIAAYRLFPHLRADLLAVGALTATAGLVMVVVVSPFLFFFFFGRHYPPVGTFFSASPPSFVKAPYFLQLTTSSHHEVALFQGSGENYLGLALIAIVGIYVWQERRDRSAWLVGGMLVVAAVLSLGKVLFTGSRYTSFPLPWQLLAHLPVLRYAIPVRFAVFAILPAAVIVARWLTVRGGGVRWGLALLAVVLFVPNVGNAAWQTHISDPAFFSSGTYRRYLRSADRVLTVPTRGPNERWQADTGFPFALAAGYAGADPASYSRYPIWNTLLTGVLTSDYATQLRRFVTAKGVTAIVVDARYPGPWRRLFAALGVLPREVGGVILYRLPPLAAAAARPGLKRSSGRSTR